jgi:hypothetical protein
MPLPSILRREPRGRPSVGFQIDLPAGVEIPTGAELRCRELRPDGKLVGELEISVFAAALIIDRDGILADKAIEVAARDTPLGTHPAAVAVALPGASGFRADAVLRAPAPYRYVFALAANDLSVDGGVLVVLHCSCPDWPAAEHMLRSLRVLTRNGRMATNGGADQGPLLPVVTPRR